MSGGMTSLDVYFQKITMASMSRTREEDMSSPSSSGREKAKGVTSPKGEEGKGRSRDFRGCLQ